MFFSSKLGLARIKALLSSPINSVHNELYTIHISSNFNSGSERLCERIGQTLRKDDSLEIRSSNINYLSMATIRIIAHNSEVEQLTLFFLNQIIKSTCTVI